MPSKKVTMRASMSNQTTHFGIMGGLFNRKISGRSSLNRVTSRLEIPASAKKGYQYMKMHNLLSRNPLGSGGVGRMFNIRPRGSGLGSHLGNVKPTTDNLGDSRPHFNPVCAPCVTDRDTGSVAWCLHQDEDFCYADDEEYCKKRPNSVWCPACAPWDAPSWMEPTFPLCPPPTPPPTENLGDSL